MSQKILLLVKRWLRYNTIGAMGLGVQLLVVIALRNHFDLNPFLATFLALQCALVHNFLWHQKWTWRSSTTRGKKASFKRFLRYHSSSGTISVLGTLGFTALFLQTLHLPYLLCNLLAIGTCNIANFLFSNTFVFQSAEAV